MKQLFIAILFSTGVYAQPNLDTIYIRNMSMQYRDWAIITSKMITFQQDSLTFAALRKIRSIVKPLNPVTAQDIVIDSLPGRFYITFFERLLFMPFIETRQRGQNIYNNITGNSLLLIHTNIIEAKYPDYNFLEIKKGKGYLIDN